ncbi:MAG TPA: globin family protein [Leptolyngbyaceae cyanobacterium]
MNLNVEILQKSIKAIKPETEDFAISFYENLFTDYPQFQPLFARTNMNQQRKHLVRALILIVENIRDAETVKDAVKPLGSRHVNYGVLHEHYPLFCATLLKTFEQYMKDEWTPELQATWSQAFEEISRLMLEGTVNPT